MDLFRYDFGYTWPWTYGHFIAAAAFTLVAVVAWAFRWRPLAIVGGVLAIWAIAGGIFVYTTLSRPVELPTARFLESGAGRVLDAGAGSGRSALMVLLARPGTRVTALDLFSVGYGIGDNSADRLRANARAAGVEPRLEVRVGDMRKMPFTDASFDAAVSAFAIDHLRREGVERTRLFRAPCGSRSLAAAVVDSRV